jgi:hypothetical protein
MMRRMVTSLPTNKLNQANKRLKDLECACLSAQVFPAAANNSLNIATRLAEDGREDDLQIFEPQTRYQSWRETSHPGHGAQSASLVLARAASTPVVVAVRVTH